MIVPRCHGRYWFSERGTPFKEQGIIHPVINHTPVPCVDTPDKGEHFLWNAWIRCTGILALILEYIVFITILSRGEVLFKVPYQIPYILIPVSWLLFEAPHDDGIKRLEAWVGAGGEIRPL